MAIRGINFTQQLLTPKDDGKLYRTILNDGFLGGGAVTALGSTLSMAAGVVIVCGRLAALGAESWPVTGAQSGYARILINVDLTRASTSTQFEQVYYTTEYSATEEGFPSLVQDDINDNGTLYQAVLSTVALSAGGISSILSTLGAATLHAAGDFTAENGSFSGNLNVGGTAQFNNSVGFIGSAYHYGALVLNPNSYGDTLPESGAEGQLFFLRV